MHCTYGAESGLVETVKSEKNLEGIRRLAKMMIEKHADHAAEHAMGHALEMRSQGDVNGEVVWLKVFDSIRALQKKELRAQTLH
jgi:hypothetical protein